MHGGDLRRREGEYIGAHVMCDARVLVLMMNRESRKRRCHHGALTAQHELSSGRVFCGERAHGGVYV